MVTNELSQLVDALHYLPFGEVSIAIVNSRRGVRL
jgi:hypothetical protein